MPEILYQQGMQDFQHVVFTCFQDAANGGFEVFELPADVSAGKYARKMRIKLNDEVRHQSRRIRLHCP